jgi:hypothetical protein
VQQLKRAIAFFCTPIVTACESTGVSRPPLQFDFNEKSLKFGMDLFWMNGFPMFARIIDNVWEYTMKILQKIVK